MAKAIADQAMEDAELNLESLDQREQRRSGCNIANQFGVQEPLPPSDKPGKLRLIKQMNHMVPCLLAIDYKFKGSVGYASMASAGGAIALGDAYR